MSLGFRRPTAGCVCVCVGGGGGRGGGVLSVWPLRRKHICTHMCMHRVGTSGKIVWKLRNVRKSLESLEMSGVLNVLEILSGKCLEIWWKYYTTLYFIKNKKGSMNPVLIHFALFLTTTWKRCDVNPYPSDWKVPLLNGCLMVSVVWKIMLLSTSLSGKKHALFKLRFWKNSINFKVLSGNLVV